MGQVVATVMTHSFTEHHNHKTLNSMTPTILLDEYHIIILLYDCIAFSRSYPGIRCAIPCGAPPDPNRFTLYASFRVSNREIIAKRLPKLDSGIWWGWSLGNQFQV